MNIIDFDMTIKVTHIVYDTIDNVDKDLPTELVFDIDSDTDDIDDDIVSAIHNITGFRRRVKSYKWTEVVDQLKKVVDFPEENLQDISTMKSESVVIYRSQFEADADAFWHDNPQYVIYFFTAILGLFLGMMLYKKFQEKNRKF